MPTYKLRYFNARGFGEVSRLLFALAGQEYEDVRFTQETWPAEKPNTPLGQMPVLDVDGQSFGQSSAISRFLARRFNFYGQGDVQALQVDQVLGIIQDIINALIKAFYEKDEERKAKALKENKEEKMPLYFGMLEKLLERNGSTGFFVGNSITLADVSVFDIYDKAKPMVDLDKFPLVKKSVDNVASNPKIKTWIEKRPQTEN